MYKLRNQASVSVICLAVVISHNLERKLKNKQTKQKTKGERETVLLQMQKDILVKKKIPAVRLVNVKAETTLSSQSCFKIQQLCEYDQFLRIQCDMIFIF